MAAAVVGHVGVAGEPTEAMELLLSKTRSNAEFLGSMTNGR